MTKNNDKNAPQVEFRFGLGPLQATPARWRDCVGRLRFFRQRARLGPGRGGSRRQEQAGKINRPGKKSTSIPKKI